MALMDIHFRDGIYIARGESNLTVQDVQAIIAELKARATHQGTPVVAILDFSRASRMASSAHILLADMTRSDRVSAVVCVTRSPTLEQSARTIAAMGESSRVHIFESMREARLFAQVCAHNQSAYA